MSVINLNHSADQPKLPRELQNLQPGMRQTAQLRLNLFYVFWLLLFVILFCAPADAENPEEGTICAPVGRVVTYTRIINQPDGSKDIVVVTCTCTSAPAPGTPEWVCQE